MKAETEKDFHKTFMIIKDDSLLLRCSKTHEQMRVINIEKKCLHDLVFSPTHALKAENRLLTFCQNVSNKLVFSSFEIITIA